MFLRQKRFVRTIVLFATLVVGLSTAINISSTMLVDDAYADVGIPKTLADKTNQYLFLSALYMADENGLLMNGDLSATAASSCKLFQHGDGQVSVGYGISTGDGIWNANTPPIGQIKSVLTNLGIDSSKGCVGLIEKFGYTYDTASGNYKPPANLNRADVLDQLSRPLGGLKGLISGPDGYIRFIARYQALQKGNCQLSGGKYKYLSGSYPQDTPSEQIDQSKAVDRDAQDARWRRVILLGGYFKFYTNDGGKEDYYIYKVGSAPTQVGLLDPGRGDAVVALNCTQIAKQLSADVDGAKDFIKRVAQLPPNEQGDLEGSGASSDCTDADPTKCSTEGGKSSCAIDGIGWLICPVLNAMGGMADHVFNFLSDNFLSVNTKLYDTSSGTYKAWAVMRDFANIVLVIGFLVIVYSQITGVGISNYGIKRMLPRLIVVAILINTSYLICQLAVDISNILGYNIKGLFDNIAGQVSSANPDGGSAGGYWSHGYTWSNILIGVLAAGIALAAIAFIAPLLIGFLCAAAMVLIALIIRKALIVLLVAVSPLAFAAYLLPNTESLFKKWWGMFKGLLLLFPITAILLGAGVLAGAILMESAPDQTSLTGISLTVAGLALPGLMLFLVWAALKKALDVIDGLGNMVNNARNKAGGWGKSKGENSAYVQNRRQKKALRKAGIAAGTYRGKGGLLNPKNIRARANARLNKSKLFNAATGGLGTFRGGSAATLRNKEVEIAQNAMMENNANAEDELKNAMLSGDSVRALAAQNLLFAQGGGGVSKFRDIVSANAGKAKGDVLDRMKAAIANGPHAGKAKEKAIDVMRWARAGGNIATQASDPDTWKLSDHDLSDQHSSTIGLWAARNNNAAGAARAQRILSDQRLSADLDEDARKHFEDVIRNNGGTPPTAQPQPQGGAPTGPTPQAPTPQAPTPTPGGNPAGGRGSTPRIPAPAPGVAPNSPAMPGSPAWRANATANASTSPTAPPVVSPGGATSPITPPSTTTPLVVPHTSPITPQPTSPIAPPTSPIAPPGNGPTTPFRPGNP